MAELDVRKKKGSSAWVWIVLLLVAIAVVVYLMSRPGDNLIPGQPGTTTDSGYHSGSDTSATP